MAEKTLSNDGPAVHLVQHGGELKIEHATVHRDPPVSATEATCLDVLGVSAKTLRAMCRDGLPSVATREGRCVLVDDFRRWVAAQATTMPREPSKPKAANDAAAEDADRALLRAGGVRLRGAR